MYLFQVDIQWTAGYENVVSSEILVGLYEKNAAALNVELHDNKGGGASTDFGNVSHVIPGLHPLFALGTKVENHSRGFTDVTGSYKIVWDRSIISFRIIIYIWFEWYMYKYAYAETTKERREWDSVRVWWWWWWWCGTQRERQRNMCVSALLQIHTHRTIGP